MKFKSFSLSISFSIALIVILFASCSKQYAVEDELFNCLENEFKSHDLDLMDVLDSLEGLYISEKILTSTNVEDYYKFNQSVIDAESMISLKNNFLREVNSKVNLYRFNLDSCALSSCGQTAYDDSKFGKISNRIDSITQATGQITKSFVAISFLCVLNPEDYKHPFYRASVLLNLHWYYFEKALGR